MLVIKLAFRTLMRRKGRMALIGVLVAFGSFLLVFGGVFASSAGTESRDSIINNFTGDFIIYSAQSRNMPTPFAFNTPLPVIKDIEKVTALLDGMQGIDAYTPYSQNYGLIEVEKDGKKQDLPFIFYAVDPLSYKSVFSNFEVQEGSFFGLSGGADVTSAGLKNTAGASASSAQQPFEEGILISRYQNEQYQNKYGVTLKSGQNIKVLGITEGGANTVSSKLVGLFKPVHYTSVFDYINFIDSETYARLYNYTGVEALPQAFDAALSSASDEDSIFALAGSDAFSNLDVDKLVARRLSGYSMIAVKLADHSTADETAAQIAAAAKEQGVDIKTAQWDEASGFYAQIALALQAFIFLAVGLIFLVVTMIFMNTLIINVVERTAEIGTMRALGADKSFIRNVFLAETLILNTFAAAVGMAAGVSALLAFKSGLPLPDTVSQFLIGGGSLYLSITAGPFIIALAGTLAVSVLATLYPVSTASSITPLKAMNDR